MVAKPQTWSRCCRSATHFTCVLNSRTNSLNEIQLPGGIVQTDENVNGIIPSDDLLNLRDLFLNWPPFFRLLEILPPFRLVIDTNAVVEELLYLVKSRKNPSARTGLQEAIDSGAVVAFAPPKLRDEIAKHIPRLARQRGVPEESLRQAWAGYQSRITFVDVREASAEEMSSAVDPDDLPFVYLYRKLDADAVLSRDRDIGAMGARSVELEVMLCVRDYAREKAPEVTLRAGALVVTVPVLAGAHILVKLLRLAAKGFAELPAGIQLALLAGALAACAHPRSRKVMSKFVSARASELRDPARILLDAAGGFIGQWGAAEERVRLKQKSLERSVPRAVKSPLRMVARSVCLEAGRALTVEELARGVLRAGYKSKSAYLKQYLLRVLRQGESFVNTPDGCWTVRASENARP
jgi:predicted nucleic acid-binding protein